MEYSNGLLYALASAKVHYMQAGNARGAFRRSRMLFGKRSRDDEGFSLIEVSLCAAPETLREIAGFLQTMASKLERGEFKTDHIHIGEHIEDWDRTHPDCDVIICHPDFDYDQIPYVESP